jgi:hypothetical protein
MIQQTIIMEAACDSFFLFLASRTPLLGNISSLKLKLHTTLQTSQVISHGNFTRKNKYSCNVHPSPQEANVGG